MSKLTIAVVLSLMVGGCGTGARYEVSPLAAAARAGDLDAIDRLLASGAAINAGSGVNDWPPIIHAIHKRQFVVLEHLLDRGAVLDEPALARALNVAHGSGDEAEVRLILDAHRGRSTVSRLPDQPISVPRP